MTEPDRGDPLDAERRFDVDPQHLVDVVDCPRLVAPALFVQSAPLPRCGDESHASFRQTDRTGVRQLTSLDRCGEVAPSVPRRLERGHPLRLDMKLPRAVPNDAVIARLAVAAAALVDRAVVLVAGEHALKPGAGVFSWHARHVLPPRVVAPALLLDPALELGDRVEPELARIEQRRLGWTWRWK